MTEVPTSAVGEAPVELGTDSTEDETAGRFGRGRHTIRFAAVGVFALSVFLSVALASGLDDEGRIAGSPLIGKAAPLFELPDIDGRASVVSYRMRGDVVVVNFWASWCVPCRREAPILEAFARRWDGGGVRVVGILYGDTLGAARSFRDEFDLTYPLVDDPDGATAVAYGITGVPETFVIDSGGVVVARIIGALGPTTLDNVLAEVQAGQTVEARNGDQQQVPASTP